MGSAQVAVTLAPVTILGGLPVIADVSFGTDSFTGEGWGEVNELFWAPKWPQLVKGKPLSQKMMDKLEKYDLYWQADVTEQASDWLSIQEYDR